MKESKTIKIKATAKIEELKKWVYKHFIGVYIGIGVAICLVMFILGLVLGQAFARPVQKSEEKTHSISVDSTSEKADATNSDFEIIIRSMTGNG